MSAVELAGIVEGWATVVGLLVVSLGAVFAGQQLLRESKARHLQAVVALYADVWPIELDGAEPMFRRYLTQILGEVHAAVGIGPAVDLRRRRSPESQRQRCDQAGDLAHP